jgi:site-specific recombinase XerD
MTPLRKKMFAVLRAKNLPLDTQEKYVAEVAAMAASYGKSPDQLTPEQVRDYLERCARQMIADKLVAFGLFYEGTLGWGWDAEAMMPRPPRNNQNPWLPDNPLRKQMLQDMGLRNLTPRTQKEYLRWIGTFADFHKESPSALGLNDVREYLVHLLDENKKPSTITVARAALRFLYANTLRRPWTLDYAPVPKREKRLPLILDQSEVAHFLDSAKSVRDRAIMMTLYAAGLRVSEVINLRVNDIDSKRKMIRVEQGKGQKDRYVMLSPRLLEELRSYWKTMRPSPWLFGGDSPISTRAIQKAVERTKKAAGLSKPVSPKTLRHCFATHMLESGARIEQIQLLLGHRSLRTTMVYIRISTSTICAGQSPLDLLPI